MKKLKDILKESNVQIGKVYSNPYAKSFVKEEEEERPHAEELTTEQKQAFLEAVKQYKKYGEAVYRNAGLGEVYESIKNMVEMAGKVTISETDDWFDNVTVSRHMKRMGESFKVFEKTLKEVSTLQQRLEASYDEIGEVLGKYYEINETEEVEEGNEFGAARAKAIANGDDSFEVDGKKYPVKDVDKDDKENAKEFTKESMKLTDMISVNEASEEFVVYVEKDNGRKKLLHTKQSQRAANMFLTKNADKILNQSGIRTIGSMSKFHWEKDEAQYAENIKKTDMKTVTKKEWDAKHNDYKGMIKGKPYMMWFDKKTQSTVYGPVNIKESVVNEAASRTAMEIGGLTGMNKDAIQKFVDDNNLDIEKVYQYVKKSKLPARMDFVTAIAGKPNNPIQKKMIKMFGESAVNEDSTTYSLINPKTKEIVSRGLTQDMLDDFKMKKRIANAKLDIIPDTKVKKTKIDKSTGKQFMESVVNEAKYDIGMARKGNGITVYNRAEEEKGDYKNIAHISDNGMVKYYDKKLPNDVKKKIEAEAQKMKESVNEEIKVGSMVTIDYPTLKKPIKSKVVRVLNDKNGLLYVMKDGSVWDAKYISTNESVNEGTKMVKLKELLKESFGMGDLPSSKLMKMKVPVKQVLKEGTRSQVGYIDNNGNIKSAYVHFDGYPENMKPGIKKHMKSEKDVKTLIKRGGARGIFDDKDIEYYDDKSAKPMSGNLEDIEKYIKDSDFKGGAEFVYLYNTKDKKWYFADTYKDKELKKLY